MATPATAIDLLRRQINDPDTQWSLGTFGAIAEFSRDPDEPVVLGETEHGVSAVTGRGALAIRLDRRCRPFASESITKSGWGQRIALCLAADDCAMSRRTVLSELDADREALRPQDRASVLFDLGLGALQADFCVRLSEPGTIAALRARAGRSVFEAGNPAMGLILAANPHRVFLSRIGRIEVYQPIPPANGKSPEGPHTHVLPKLLKANRTHPATEPIPMGWIPCAHIYPPHPARDGMGQPRPFDPESHHSFQQMIEMFGDAESRSIKRRVFEAVHSGAPPSAMAQDRHGRTGIRIALRQMKAGGHASPALQSWLANFDSAGLGQDDDDSAIHHGS